jgi:hypothetical protein
MVLAFPTFTIIQCHIIPFYPFGETFFLLAIGFIVYKYVQKHRRYNAAPVLALDRLDYERQSHSSTDTNIDDEVRTDNMQTIYQPKTPLNYVSVTSSSRSSSPSPEGSINSGSRRSSLNSNDVLGHYL